MPPIDRAPFRRRLAPLAAAATAALLVAGCAGGGLFGETSQHGYIVSESALAQVPVGSSREQVQLALGTPSTTATFGGEVFYYISQTRYRAVEFLDSQIVDQRVLAVYFDDTGRVSRIADYGLQDGEVFDFVTRTTPTGGADLNFIQQMLRGLTGR